VSQMAGREISLGVAALAVLIAAVTNGITKLTLAVTLAPAKIGCILAGAGAAAVLAGAAAFALTPS
ncbi:MAG: hypothetical protein J0H79_04445, partial [Alphaproteobacteria bacterium]|nr:hypothetical protein [Alphaproteobacteria bacterium]